MAVQASYDSESDDEPLFAGGQTFSELLGAAVASSRGADSDDEEDVTRELADLPETDDPHELIMYALGVSKELRIAKELGQHIVGEHENALRHTRRLEAALMQANALQEATQTSLTERETEVTRVNIRLGDLQTDVDELDSRIKKQEREKMRLQQALDAQARELDRLQVESDEKPREATLKAEQKVRELEREKESFLERETALELEKKQLVRKLDQISKEAHTISMDVNQRDEQIKTFERENEQLQEDVEQMKVEYHQLEQRMLTIMDQKMRLAEESERLREQEKQREEKSLSLATPAEDAPVPETELQTPRTKRTSLMAQLGGGSRSGLEAGATADQKPANLLSRENAAGGSRDALREFFFMTCISVKYSMSLNASQSDSDTGATDLYKKAMQQHIPFHLFGKWIEKQVSDRIHVPRPDGLEGNGENDADMDAACLYAGYITKLAQSKLSQSKLGAKIGGRFGLLENWRTRWFEIRDGSFLYYKNKPKLNGKRPKPRGVLNLEEIVSVRTRVRHEAIDRQLHPFTFVVTVANKETWFLSVSSDRNLRGWYTVLIQNCPNIKESDYQDKLSEQTPVA